MRKERVPVLQRKYSAVSVPPFKYRTLPSLTPRYLDPQLVHPQQQSSQSSLSINRHPSATRSRPKRRRDFHIAVMCALGDEYHAIEGFLDESFENDYFHYRKSERDSNSYTTGRIGEQAVVVVYIAGMGKVSATKAAINLRNSFRRIKVVFLVGVCGAAPRDTKQKEILLGDIIISTAVIQVDFGRQYPDGFIRKEAPEDAIGPPNAEIRSFLQYIQTKHTHRGLEDDTSTYITELCNRDGFRGCAYPEMANRSLYHSNYLHKHHDGYACKLCAKCRGPDDPICETARTTPCGRLGCSDAESVPRDKSRGTRPAIHFGLFASSDTVMKSGVHRDKIVDKERVIAFEMEGAGCWAELPTVIIKCACDYADSHKNKDW